VLKIQYLEVKVKGSVDSINHSLIINHLRPAVNGQIWFRKINLCEPYKPDA